MLPKFIRYLESSIEEGIIASFGDVVFREEPLLEKTLGNDFLVLCRRITKRGLDIFMSTVLMFMCLPLFLFITIIIKMTSPGPIFFRQERVGYRGKAFRIFKFRTMHKDNSKEEHEQYVHYLLKEGTNAQNRIDLLTKYIDYIDKRTTKFGRFLRATSLDELPQLINIFIGNMSLVGPRPHPTYEVKEYKEWYRRRLHVKPGLTGWSKLNLRCTPKNYEEAILYDLWYVDHWSLLLDLRVLLMTIPFVLFRKDAY